MWAGRLLRFQGSQGYRLGVSRINTRTNPVVFVSNLSLFYEQPTFGSRTRSLGLSTSTSISSLDHVYSRISKGSIVDRG